MFSTTGRSVFRTDESISLRVPAHSDQVKVILTASGGRVREAVVPAADDYAYLTILPDALSAGDWTLTAGEERWTFTVVSAIPRTPFTIGVFAGWFEGDHPQYYNLSGVSSEERVRASAEDYGVNLIMLQNRGFPMQPHTVDLLLRAGAQFTTLNTLATMHQPEGEKNDWSNPEVIESCCYRVLHAAQYLRHYGGFRGVHFADEPGLTWGLETPDGRTFLYGEKEAEPGDYQGPLAIAIQREMYRQATGKEAPNWRRPFDDFDAWMDYMRWRTTILGDTFARFTRELHQVDPRLIGYCQIYEWAVVGDGCYPPEEAHGVDILCTHAYCDRQLGFWYPAHETDAMRSGAWDKPLWMLPTWDMGITPPYGVRACLYSTLARKVEGVLWSHDWMMSWPQAKEVTARILPISGMLLHAQKLRDAVGIFYSRDQHLYAYAEQVMDSAGAGREYVGRLNTAWLLAMASHRPASWLLEEELLAGLGAAHRVLIAPALTYVRPEIKTALEQYIVNGGVLILDASSTVDIAGAQRLPFAFADCYNPTKGRYQDWTDRRRFDELVAPYLDAFTEALAPYVDSVAQCNNPQFMLSLQGADAGTYLWVINMVQEDRRDEQNRPRCLVPASATITLPDAAAIYDVFARRRLDKRTLTLDLDQGDARLYALLPAAITHVAINKITWQAPGLTVQASIGGGEGTLDVTIPLQTDLIAPDGTTTATLFRATRHGEYAEQLSLGTALMEGTWRVVVTELLSGISSTGEFTVTDAIHPWAETAMVDILDAAQIARTLTAGKPLYILTGDPQSAQAAVQCATALRAAGIQAVTEDAANYLLERPTTPHTVNPPSGAPLAINKQVILIGNRETNPLIANLVDTHQLTPRQLDENYPGKGRALVYWLRGLFGLDNDIIVIYASDAEGMGQGIKKMLAVQQGS